LKSPLQRTFGGEQYVGVKLPEMILGFDLEQNMQDIHLELADLNQKAFELATTIQSNFGELGI